MNDKLLRDLLLGFVKVHILHHADKEPIFGQEFHEELKRHGYDLSFGTLYPIFHKLEADGYLKSKKENINGKIRRYYSITATGKKLLNKAKEQAKELVEELFED
ncbi:MAG: PadR family transcriptional regulator [Melioribacteraceae bacterium]|nr:helix-turn-helix transcriptional regulator [Melioribacteraceae bacterium]MDD3557886.1 PadR family transcriptional regulator [Melioribacteraceae bacterium]